MKNDDRKTLNMAVVPVIFIALMLSSVAKNFGALGQRVMSNSSGIYSVAYVTVPSQDVAKKIAHGLVSGKLAACVNIIPQITSVYEWKGEINEDNELLLMIKTRTETVEALTKYVIEAHPYETCEVISLPIENGSAKYLNWIGGVVPSSMEKGNASEKSE